MVTRVPHIGNGCCAAKFTAGAAPRRSGACVSLRTPRGSPDHAPAPQLPAYRRAGWPPVVRGAGTVIRKVLPTPGVLSTVIVPPSRSTRRLTTCRPRPRPSKRRVLEPSPHGTKPRLARARPGPCRRLLLSSARPSPPARRGGAGGDGAAGRWAEDGIIARVG